ncbi:MAG TPA: serine/threonine-protein kinase [Polyangiaceae bacterium]|jgi:serine/threonine-protein kinase
MERIGEYEVRRMVGEGGMGKVYEAEERLSKRRVALKVLRPELTRSEEGRRLFLNEMQILAQLEHPNVVRSLATCEVDGQLVMALEYLEGRTLRQALVDEGRLPWPVAVRIVVAVGEGLAAAHGHATPIVHRDLKPENVMLVDGDAVKVMDFGVAKVLAEAQATNTQSVGTLQYMSPEQIDARTIDARSDLYALGLLLYECLAGAPPFRSASARELLNLQCTAPAPELPDEVRATLPAGVEQVLFQMLEKSPDARPPSAGDVLARLAPFVSAGSRAHRSASSGSRPRSVGGDDSRSSSASARKESSTLVSTPAPAVPRRADTVDLVERATQPREMATWVALSLILLLSVVSALTVYVLRLRVPVGPQTARDDVPAKAVGAPVR